MLKRLTYLLIISLGTIMLLPAELYSQTIPNRAGLVIDFGNGQMHTQCVSFDEEQINGYELIQRAGLPLEVDINGGVGAAVCSINNVGCPGTDCFCQCPGGDNCVYWSYWHLLDNNWQYAVIGASNRTIRNGDVDGWVWGPGSVSNASPQSAPRLTKFAPPKPHPPIHQFLHKHTDRSPPYQYTNRSAAYTHANTVTHLHLNPITNTGRHGRARDQLHGH